MEWGVFFYFHHLAKTRALLYGLTLPTLCCLVHKLLTSFVFCWRIFLKFLWLVNRQEKHAELPPFEDLC